MIKYLIGVDGGGSGTRVRVEHPDGTELGRANGGPSGLMHGIGNAWNAILHAVDLAFAQAGVGRPALEKMGIGLGLAGVHNKQWTAEFIGKNLGFGSIVVETDAFCSLLGAHRGRAGIIIAIGTGSVGEALLPDGTHREVGGWGFPCSDEGSGAWLGMRAVNYVQRVMDGRCAASDFSQALAAETGRERDELFKWLSQANQTAYAKLAPIVVRYAAHDNMARKFMMVAGNEIADIAVALDSSAQLPIALCGGLADAVSHYLPEQLRGRMVKPQADAVSGALQLLRQKLG